MTVDITEIPYADIKPNSVLMIRVPAFGLQDKKMVDALTQGLRDKVDESVSVLIIRDDTVVELLTERAMNSAGWFKGVTP